MDRDPYAVVVPVGRPTVAPPRLPPILIPGSLVPVQLAEPWRRACAWTVDVVPFLLLAYGLAVAVQGSRVGSALWPGIFTKNYDTRAMGLPEVGLSQVPSSAELQGLMLFAGAMLFVFALWTAYRVLLVARAGGTLGKRLLEIAVVDAADPRRHPSLAAAVRRSLVPQAAGLVPVPCTGMVPYLWLLKDSRRQGLHDRAAGTLVVRRPR
ncbi:MAG: hypothetical protein QOI26_351 [Pseudonocardiales bacterium]|nr:hypothetical protein [Pseudonocardiales bacterium]